ncbi:MAG: hypothetical protein ACFFB8_16445 [Promethearchaeota archaeon]
MKEIKNLYEKLHITPNEEREKLWNIIIEKNRVLLNKKKEDLKKGLKKTL